MIYGHIDGEQQGCHYREHLSNFSDWEAKSHAQDWLVFPENIGEKLSIDETSISQGELYTIVTNKAAHGGRGTIVAIVSGTKSNEVIEALERIPDALRAKVKEVTLDMSPSMRRIVSSCFPKAIRVIDRFHVQKLTYDAVQKMRIAFRWDAINEETDAMEEAKLSGKEYIPQILENGDSKKQLPARCRYLLFKSAEKWTEKQKQRAKILFELCPSLKKAYPSAHSLRMIFSKNSIREAARLSLAGWYNQVAGSEFRSFNTIAATIYEHYEEILNFFINRYTNASAEAFNAKIKEFRANLKGVADVDFFLFRLSGCK